MEEIIQIIEDQINELIESQEKNKEYIRQLEELKQRINSYRENPNIIDSNEYAFKEDFSDENVESIIALKGLYEYKEEPQVSSALEYLDKLVTKKLDSIDKEISQYDDNLENKINEYNDILNLLKNYNDRQYITLEQINKIKEIVGSKQVLLKLYSIVVINNSTIENEKSISRNDEVLPIEVVEDLDNRRASINVTQEQIDEKKVKIEEYLNRINYFLNNSEYKEMNVDLYNISSRIMNYAKEVLEREDIELDVFDVVENDMVADDIKWLEDNYLKLGIVKALLYAYENNDIQQVKELLEIYKINPTNDIKDYLELEGYKEYFDILSLLETKYNAKEKLTSVIGINYDDVKNLSDRSNLQDDTYLLQIIYKDIVELLNDRTMNDEIKGKLDELIKRANKILESYGEVIKITVEKDEIADHYGSYDNYIVFYDENSFMESYDELRNEHREMAAALSSDVSRKINKLIGTELPKLIADDDCAHNIHVKRNTPNSYEILAVRKGKTRLSYKVIEDAYVTDENGRKHPIIMVIHSCFGEADGRSKSTNLLKGIKIFEKIELVKDENGKTRYDRLKEIFTVGKDEHIISKEAQKELEKALNIIKKVQEDSLQNRDENYIEELLDEEIEEDKELGGNGHGRK
ncbi:MAG: hypothetical protein IJ097_03940 [Bacilli bacterium]|nr:hypothetical protein [Bacilli bacterium]